MADLINYRASPDGDIVNAAIFTKSTEQDRRESLLRGFASSLQPLFLFLNCSGSANSEARTSTRDPLSAFRGQPEHSLPSSVQRYDLSFCLSYAHAHLFPLVHIISVKKAADIVGLPAKFFRVPSDYYSWPLERRRYEEGIFQTGPLHPRGEKAEPLILLSESTSERRLFTICARALYWRTRPAHRYRGCNSKICVVCVCMGVDVEKTRFMTASDWHRGGLQR